MKNGRDQKDQDTNVISLAGARKRAKGASRVGKGTRDGQRRSTTAQSLMSAFMVALAIGGALALAVPLLRAAGLVGG